MEAIVSIITTVGFPIVAALGLAWFIYHVWNKNTEQTEKRIDVIEQRSKEREDRLYEQIDKFGSTLNNFNATLASIDTRLEIIEHQTNDSYKPKNEKN